MWPTLNSIRQTDVDTLMIRTQSRVRVRVRVIYLNQTGIRHQILGGVGNRVMHSRSDAPSHFVTFVTLSCTPLQLDFFTVEFQNRGGPIV